MKTLCFHTVKKMGGLSSEIRVSVVIFYPAFMTRIQCRKKRQSPLLSLWEIEICCVDTEIGLVWNMAWYIVLCVRQ